MVEGSREVAVALFVCRSKQVAFFACSRVVEKEHGHAEFAHFDLSTNGFVKILQKNTC